MFDALETGIGLDIVLWFQHLRSGPVDAIVQGLNFAGHELFYIAVLGFIYWVYNKRLGMRMLFALVTITLLTLCVKDILARPRPYQVSDLVKPLLTENQYGIPSGHVSIGLMVWGYLALWLRKRWFTITVVVYITVQFFARMIAGVHYPQDVTAGLLLGAISLAIYYRYAEKVVNFWKKQSLSIQIAIPVVLGLLGLIAISVIPLQQSQIDNYAPVFGLLWGAGLAAAVEGRYIKFQASESNLTRAIQFIVGLVLAVVLLKGLGIAFDAITQTGVLEATLRVIRYGLTLFFAMALWPYLSIRFNLMNSEEANKAADSA